MKTIMFLCFVVVLFSGCAIFLQVRQSDLEAWKGVPVEALDTHSLFLTVPMVKTVSESGVEIRDYVNKVGVSSCSQFGRLTYANFNSFQNCSTLPGNCWIGCLPNLALCFLEPRSLRACWQAWLSYITESQRLMADILPPID